MTKVNIFKKYNSIENAYREKTIYHIQETVPIDEQWCVTEKIHGANIQIWSNGEEVLYGKRSSFMGLDCNFYNFQNILPRYKDAMMKISKDLGKEVRIFGEIFGGRFNGVTGGHKMVQKEVEYSEDIECAFFDMVIDDEFVPYAEAEKVFAEHNIPFVKTIFKGSLAECLEQSNEFPSRICEMFGLEVIEKNVCEGTVIKPYHNEYLLHCGSRVILKNKNSKFTEKTGAVKSTVKKEYNEGDSKLIVEISQYITLNRLNAVFSKDIYEQKDFGKFMQDFNADMYEDALKDNEDMIVSDFIKKVMNGKVAYFCKKEFFSRV